jgi:hypothetical protein
MTSTRDPERSTLQPDVKPTRRVRHGQNVTRTEDIAAIVERSRDIRIGEPDDAEYEELTEHDEAAKSTDRISALELRIAKLEAVSNASAWEVNRHNKHLILLTKGFGRMTESPWYRFLLWIMPLPLPRYKEGRTVPHIVRYDTRPSYHQSDFSE